MKDIKTGLSKSVSTMTFAFVDVETTGLSVTRGERICEVAVSKRHGNSDLGHFQTLITPGRRMPDEVVRIHGITNEMVADSPRFERIAPKLLGLLEGSVVVCHNAGFDIPFLANEFSLTGLRFPEVRVVDTLKMARRYGNFRSNRLGNIATDLGITTQGWHRALSDVKMMEQIFFCFLKSYGDTIIK